MASSLEDLKRDYWMVRKLGSGGFGTVYLLRQRTTKQLFAAKEQPGTDARCKQNIEKEVSILKKLINADKRFVVQFITWFEGRNLSVILTEFLEGDELFRRISSPKYTLTHTKCRTFARQILVAIDFIHSQGIVHLDLKPENIVLQKNIERKPSSMSRKLESNKSILCSALAANCSNIANIAAESSIADEQLKIIDFGLAKELSGKTRIGINLCGTIEYISPEVMRCSHASYASDLWSTGVIFYMMVTGGLSPFWDGNEGRTQRLILRGHFANKGFSNKLFNDVPKSAIDCIARLLEVNPESRYTISECLNHRWLTTDYVEAVQNVETMGLRKYIARRRWQKVFIAIKAMNRMVKLGVFGSFAKALNDVNEMSFIEQEPSQLTEVWI